MGGSADELPDAIPLDEAELIKRKYQLDDKASEAIKYITQNVPLANIRALISEDYWLRKLIPIIESVDSSDMSKLRALELFGRYLGLFNAKKKTGSKKVLFEND